EAPEGARTIACLGRLGHEKGFDLLLESFALCCDGNPDWRLVIYGEGSERKHLEQMAHELKIEDKVLLPGQIQNPRQVLEEVDLFVLPSRFEGFPNALLEAMSYGLPVISFDCPSGPREIIRNNKDGILVAPGDVRLLASAMKRLMNDSNERKRLGESARRVRERFSMENIMKMWEEVLTGGNCCG
ncbi:MAG TPA: glycosyltransferase, partial [Desulfatiglandales bacterium]